MTLKRKDKIFWPKPGDVIKAGSRDDIVDAVSAFDPALWSDSVLESYKKVTLIKAVEESMKEDLDKLATLVDELQDAQEITGKALAEQIGKVQDLEDELEQVKRRADEQMSATEYALLQQQASLNQQRTGAQHTHASGTGIGVQSSLNNNLLRNLSSASGTFRGNSK